MLGNGGRLQIDNGGLVLGITNFTWQGANGTIVLNNGGTLFTTAAITLGGSAVSLTGQVTSASATGGVWNFGNQTLAFSKNFNSLTVNNATLTNLGAVTIGSTANSVGNSLTFSNGGRFFSGALGLGTATGANSNSYNVGGAGLSSTVFNNGTLTLGNAGSGFDTLTVTNATLTTGGSFVFIGLNSTSNQVNILANGTWNAGGQDFYIAPVDHNGAASNNVVTVNGGVLTNVHALYVGNSAQGPVSSFNSLMVTNGGMVTAATGMIIDSEGGGGAAGSGDSVVVTGTGSVLKVGSSGIAVSDSGITGASNSLTVANGGVVINNGLFVVGNNNTSSTNWALVTGSGSVLSNVGPMTIGARNSSFDSLVISNGGLMISIGSTLLGGLAGSADISNSVLVTGSGSVWTNSSTFALGIGSNTVTVANGGAIFATAANVGTTTGSGNLLAATDPGSRLQISGAVLLGQSGGSDNQLLVSNGASFASGSVTIGSDANADGNTFTVVNATSSNTSINVGGINNSGNQLLVANGGLVNASGAVSVGSLGAANLLTIASGGTLFAASLNIGVGGSNNTVLVTDASSTLGVSGGLTLGGNSNQLIVSNGASLFGGPVTVGSGAGANNNSFTVNGGITSNDLITVGSAGGGFNNMLVTNASIQSQGLALGTGSSNNTVSVQANATWNLLGQNVTVGSLASTGNVLNINGLLTNGGTVTVGNGNSIGNSLVIGNGGTLIAAAVNAGNVAGDNNNSVQVINGGLLEANALVIAAGAAGNTISNRNSTYQFTTGAPTTTPNGLGSIAITDGTISYRGIDSADVTANRGSGALSGITFAGANTFMLNASSNINVSGGVDQSYTFQASAGNPSNYVNLVMVNGQTEYGNGDLTIGATGTLLISNTTAGIDGNFVNSGTASVVNATANFANTLNNHGRLTLQNATVNATTVNFATGIIHGNGTITSDVSSLGTISPVGTLTFSGNLTLLGSSVVIMELTGAGSNDVINVGASFQSAGKLVVTNTTGFAYAYGQEFYIFNFGSGNQNGDFSVTNLPDLTPGLAWNTTQLDTNGLLIVVPEPSSALLLAVGALVIWFWYRLQARQVSRSMNSGGSRQLMGLNSLGCSIQRNNAPTANSTCRLDCKL